LPTVQSKVPMPWQPHTTYRKCPLYLAPIQKNQRCR
jgi:hypothetical protein